MDSLLFVMKSVNYPAHIMGFFNFWNFLNVTLADSTVPAFPLRCHQLHNRQDSERKRMPRSKATPKPRTKKEHD